MNFFINWGWGGGEILTDKHSVTEREKKGGVGTRKRERERDTHTHTERQRPDKEREITGRQTEEKEKMLLTTDD